MDDYTPNSNRFKEQQKENATLPEKKIQQITTGKVRVKKKSEMSKFKDVFISEDVSNVKSYI